MGSVMPGLLKPGRAPGTVEKVGEFDGELCPSRALLSLAWPWVRHIVLQHPTLVQKEEPCKCIAHLQDPNPRASCPQTLCIPRGLAGAGSKAWGQPRWMKEEVLWLHQPILAFIFRLATCSHSPWADVSTHKLSALFLGSAEITHRAWLCIEEHIFFFPF